MICNLPMSTWLSYAMCLEHTEHISNTANLQASLGVRNGMICIFCLKLHPQNLSYLVLMGSIQLNDFTN